MLEKIKDPGSAITHFIGMLMAMFAATPLIIKSLHEPDYIHVISLTVFIVSMILLYAASTIYHTLNLSERTNRILRKLDHSMIFVLIAGSYTPICLIVLKGPVGYFLFALVWAIALIGIIVKICWITCPKWFSSVLYISMGWVCVPHARICAKNFLLFCVISLLLNFLYLLCTSAIRRMLYQMDVCVSIIVYFSYGCNIFA